MRRRPICADEYDDYEDDYWIARKEAEMGKMLTLDSPLPQDWSSVFTQLPCRWSDEPVTVREALDARPDNWGWIAEYSRDQYKPLLVGYFITRLRDEDEDVWVRQSAVHALGYIGDARAVEPLTACLNDEDEDVWVRGSAVHALGRIGGERVVEPLIVYLRDEDEDVWVRRSAAGALGYIGDARAVEPLIACLNDEHWQVRVRRSAAEALGRIADARAMEPLTACLNDEDEWVRGYAERALENITGGE